MTTISVVDSYLLAAGSTLTFANETGLIVRPGPIQPVDVVRIEGTLQIAYNQGLNVEAIGISALSLYPGNPNAAVTIGPGGRVEVSATGSIEGRAGAFVAREPYAPDLINQGMIQVSAVGSATGVRSSSSDWSLDNSGSVNVVSSSSNVIGASLEYGGAVKNSGTISAIGKDFAIGVGIYSYGPTSLHNSGAIFAQDGVSGLESYGVYWRLASTALIFPPLNTFVNSGRIEGDYSLFVINEFSRGQPPQLFTNTGSLIGRVEMGANDTQLVNSGLIRGDVGLGSGADTYSGAGGVTVGMISGGEGNDSLSGGAGFDNFQGNVGNDTASGGDGEDWVVGGKDNDSLSGDAAYDLVYGNLGNDTCDGGTGNDIVRGGQDDDLCLGGDGDDYVSGDKGSDTMTGGLGADVFHTFGDAGTDWVTDFSLAQGDRVQLDPGTQYTVSQSGADTVINMTGGGQMILVGVQMSTLTPGWIFGA